MNVASTSSSPSILKMRELVSDLHYATWTDQPIAADAVSPYPDTMERAEVRGETNVLLSQMKSFLLDHSYREAPPTVQQAEAELEQQVKQSGVRLVRNLAIGTALGTGLGVAASFAPAFSGAPLIANVLFTGFMAFLGGGSAAVVSLDGGGDYFSQRQLRDSLKSWDQAVQAHGGWEVAHGPAADQVESGYKRAQAYYRAWAD